MASISLIFDQMVLFNYDIYLLQQINPTILLLAIFFFTNNTAHIFFFLLSQKHNGTFI